MKVLIINKSDATGGAAVVSFRLMEALRAAGADARMLVAEKRTQSPFVEKAASDAAIRIPFLTERLGIFFDNGFNRADLFKVDTASCGLPLWRHPRVLEADVICLNWVNQGMLSLEGIRRIAALGKPIVWTMHDMWCLTGICHHAATCSRWLGGCGDCPLLGRRAGRSDASARTHRRKARLYADARPVFVAVSRWLADKAARSRLLAEADVRVIPNAFPLSALTPREPRQADAPVTLIAGAARLDDPVKGLPLLLAALRLLREENPALAARLRLLTFGSLRDAEAMSGVAIDHTHLGTLSGDDVARAYRQADIVISSSLYETLPGTLVEGQHYGCIPVSFDRGGQRDIVSDGETGFLAHLADDDAPEASARALADAIARAAAVAADPESLARIRERMSQSVRDKFAAPRVAEAYLGLFRSLLAAT